MLIKYSSFLVCPWPCLHSALITSHTNYFKIFRNRRSSTSQSPFLPSSCVQLLGRVNFLETYLITSSLLLKPPRILIIKHSLEFSAQRSGLQPGRSVSSGTQHVLPVVMFPTPGTLLGTSSALMHMCKHKMPVITKHSNILCTTKKKICKLKYGKIHSFL